MIRSFLVPDYGHCTGYSIAIFFFLPVSEEIPSKFILAQLLYYARCPVSIIYFAQSKGTFT